MLIALSLEHFFSKDTPSVSPQSGEPPSHAGGNPRLGGICPKHMGKCYKNFAPKIINLWQNAKFFPQGVGKGWTSKEMFENQINPMIVPTM